MLGASSHRSLVGCALIDTSRSVGLARILRSGLLQARQKLVDCLGELDGWAGLEVCVAAERRSQLQRPSGGEGQAAAARASRENTAAFLTGARSYRDGSGRNLDSRSADATRNSEIYRHRLADARWVR